jgi:diguanylate cyclase (GGDEF)-like protein
LILSTLVQCPSAAPVEAAAPADGVRLLRKADHQRLLDYPAFVQTLRDAHSEPLEPRQADYLHYLEGWKDAYEGHDGAALEELRPLMTAASDFSLRFRAEVTAVHVLSLAMRYEEAYTLLATALGQLPRISDRDAREQGLLDAAELYGDVGQYDLSQSYAQTLIEENWAGRGRCEGGTERVRSLLETGRLGYDTQVLSVIQACRKAGETLYASKARMVLGRFYNGAGRYDDAIRLLTAHYEEVERLYNPRLLSAYNALLAQSYYSRGKVNLADELARRVVMSSIDRQSAPLADAYQVLYEIARERGDFRAALAFHEKYAAVDKAYLDEVSARSLAFQRVMHESIAHQLQVAALSRRNSVLQLQEQLSEQAAKTSRLQVILLTVVLSFLGLMTALIAVWACRTKRLQLHFMTLSRTDALTGIYNRPYFIEQAESLLEHSRRAGLDVSVVLWDADHFKAVNDRFGHAAGDSVLRRMVGACKAQLRRTDILGRFGGEEFAVVLPGCSAEEAAQRANIVRTAMSRIAVLEGQPGSGTVSASFGVSCTRVSGYELGGLLGHADAALYTAKGAGRNRVVIYDATRDTDPDPGGTASATASAVVSAHVRGVKARQRPASLRRWLRPRDGRVRPYRGRASSGDGGSPSRSLCCSQMQPLECEVRRVHGRTAAQDCRRGGFFDS